MRLTHAVTAFLLAALPMLALSHHDSEPGTGPDAMLQHMEVGDELAMEMVMPHRRASGNQLMLNFFTAESGETAMPESVSVLFVPEGSEPDQDPIPFDSNGPTYSGTTAGVTGPGDWVVRVEARMGADEVAHFEVPVELF